MTDSIKDISELTLDELPTKYLAMFAAENAAIQRRAIASAGKRPCHVVMSSPTGNRYQRRLWAADNRKKGGSK